MPDVLAVRFGVETVSGPMAPEVLVRSMEVEPVTVPVPVMEPEPEAVMVSAVPDVLASRTMPLLVPEPTRVRVPEAVMELVMVKAPAPLAESVRLKLAPVDAPVVVRA